MIKTIIVKLIFLGITAEAPYCPIVDQYVLDIDTAFKEELDLNLKYEVSYEADTPYPEQYLFQISSKFTALNKGVSKNNKRTITQYITAPFNDIDGAPYIAGLAKVCFRRYKKPMGLSSFMLKNKEGVDRYQQDIDVVRHEVLHQLGCSHDNDEYSLMHPNALYYSSLHPVFIMEKCRRQIRRCLSE